MLRKPIPLPSSLAYIHRPTFSLTTTQILLCVYVDVPPRCHKIPQTPCPSCSSTRARRHKINVPLCTHASPFATQNHSHGDHSALHLDVDVNPCRIALGSIDTRPHRFFLRKNEEESRAGAGKAPTACQAHYICIKHVIFAIGRTTHLPCAYYMFQCSVRGGCCFNQEALHTSSLVSFLTSLSYLWLHTYPDPITHLHTNI